MRRAILNQVIDRSRRAGTWRRVRHLAVAPASVDSAAGATDERLDLLERVRELPPRQAACIVLRYYEDLTVDGVANVLGISSGAVKRYLSDGLRTLSSSIDPHGARSARTGGENVGT